MRPVRMSKRGQNTPDTTALISHVRASPSYFLFFTSEVKASRYLVEMSSIDTEDVNPCGGVMTILISPFPFSGRRTSSLNV